MVVLRRPHLLLMHGRPVPSTPETPSHVCRRMCACRRTACCWVRDGDLRLRRGVWGRAGCTTACAP